MTSETYSTNKHPNALKTRFYFEGSLVVKYEKECSHNTIENLQNIVVPPLKGHHTSATCLCTKLINVTYFGSKQISHISNNFTIIKLVNIKPLSVDYLAVNLPRLVSVE